jgi:glycosyltransferase involved in cell wall biosynthesis
MLRMATVVVAGSDNAEQQLSRFSANVRMIPVIALARESETRNADNLQPRVGLVAPDNSAILRSVVRALALAKQKYPRAELAVMVSGGQIDKVISCMRETTRNGVEVIACESESQMIQALGTCDVYLETSPQVDPSPAFIEALALGRPIIATDTCGMVSSINHGANGLVVAAGNHAELANRLCDLVESPALVKILSEGALSLAGVNDRSAAVAAWVYLYSTLSSSGTAMPRRRRFLPQYQTSVKA